jgi:hypothetical protein
MFKISTSKSWCPVRSYEEGTNDLIASSDRLAQSERKKEQRLANQTGQVWKSSSPLVGGLGQWGASLSCDSSVHSQPEWSHTELAVMKVTCNNTQHSWVNKANYKQNSNHKQQSVGWEIRSTHNLNKPPSVQIFHLTLLPESKYKFWAGYGGSVLNHPSGDGGRKISVLGQHGQKRKPSLKKQTKNKGIRAWLRVLA